MSSNNFFNLNCLFWFYHGVVFQCYHGNLRANPMCSAQMGGLMADFLLLYTLFIVIEGLI